MKIVCVDDEKISLDNTMILCKECGVTNVAGFNSSTAALEYFSSHKDTDIAFLDIDMPIINGLDLAKKLNEVSPNTFIIFLTGYKQYALEAFHAHAIGYITKPIRKEELQAEIDRVSELKGEKKKRVRIHAFGNFEVFFDEKPIEFKYRKTKELFAYLVDRNGVDISTGEIMSVLFEDEDKASYLRNLISDLVQTFDSINTDIIRRSRGKLGLNKSLVDCDYYDYLNGNKKLFKGEYMSQYEFSELTLAGLGR